MSQNIQQVYIANPATSLQNTDLFYIGRSPYGTGNDMGLPFSVIKPYFLQPSNNLSDVANAATALSNLNGLSLSGGTMTGALTLAADPVSSLQPVTLQYFNAHGGGTVTLTGDVTGSGTGTVPTTIANSSVTLSKLANLGATSLIGNSTGSSATPTAVPFSTFLQSANNLSDLSNLATARTNLGLGTAATKTVSSNLVTTVAGVNGIISSGNLAVYTDNVGTLVDLGIPANNVMVTTGDTMTGPLVLYGNPTTTLQAATKQYVDSAISGLPTGSAQSVYVSQDGNDTTGTGSVLKPFATISKAMSVITTATITTPFSILVFGKITEAANVSLKPNVSIFGFNAVISINGTYVLDSSFLTVTSLQYYQNILSTVTSNPNLDFSAAGASSHNTGFLISNFGFTTTTTFTITGSNQEYASINNCFNNNVGFNLTLTNLSTGYFYNSAFNNLVIQNTTSSFLRFQIGNLMNFGSITIRGTSTGQMFVLARAINNSTSITIDGNAVLDIDTVEAVPTLVNGASWNPAIRYESIKGTSNGGIFYSNATRMQLLNGTATANLPLLSGASTTPTWSAFPLSLGGALTTAGAFTMSGAFGFTGTLTGTTAVTFPTSGTLLSTSTGAALTSNNDTNVTITLGGSPTTALVNATSLTMGWTGQLAMSRGGTGANLVASNGGIVYSTASNLTITASVNNAVLSTNGSGTPSLSTTLPNNLAMQTPASITLTNATGLPLTTGVTGILPLANGGTNANLIAANGAIPYSTGTAIALLAPTATANQLFMSGASGAPAWSTLTFPTTIAHNNLLYASAANQISTIAAASSAVLVTDASQNPSLSTTIPLITQRNITELNNITATFTLGGQLRTFCPAAGSIANSTTTASFTPTIAFGGATTGITYSSQIGRYCLTTMPDGTIHCECWIQIALSNKGSATGVFSLTNLPLTSGTSAVFAFPVATENTVTASGTNIWGVVDNNALTASFYYYSNNAFAAQMNNSNFTNTSTIRCYISYWNTN